MINGLGLLTFDYTFDYSVTGGDPAGGCGKNMVITYDCNDGVIKTFESTPNQEFGFGGQVHLDCNDL